MIPARRFESALHPTEYRARCSIAEDEGSASRRELKGRVALRALDLRSVSGGTLNGL